MFTLCYYADIMLPLNVYYAVINFKSILFCYYVAIMRLLLFDTSKSEFEQVSIL